MGFSFLRVREFRKDNGLSQNDLVRKLCEFARESLDLDFSITPETIRNWEHQRSTPSCEHLEVLQSYALSAGYNPLYFFDTFEPKRE